MRLDHLLSKENAEQPEGWAEILLVNLDSGWTLVLFNLESALHFLKQTGNSYGLIAQVVRAHA